MQKFHSETAELIQTNPLWNRLEIPVNYFMVKEALEERFQKSRQGFSDEHIKKEIFDQIAADNGVESGYSERLLKDLHELYELAYSKDTDDIITIPFLLKEEQPEKLPVFLISDSLMLQYTAEQPLPPNTVSRLIVHHNGEIRSEYEIWRYGVILEYKTERLHWFRKKLVKLA